MNPGSAPADFIAALLAPLREAACADGLWRPAPVPRGMTLMRQGAPAPSVFVLEAGLVKLAYLTPEGSERIKSFIADQGLFGPGTGEDEGRFTATALEPSRIVALPVRWLAGVSARPAIQAVRLEFEAWVRRRKEARERALLCDSAEDRYRALLRDAPRLAARLQQADIARYIGVTPIAFSRIKRRLRAG